MTLHIQSAIYGRDSGGFAWENVVAFKGIPDGAQTVWAMLKALNDQIIANVIPAIGAAISEDAEILGVTSKLVAPDSSPSRNSPRPTIGGRSAQQYPGGVCGRVIFIPDPPGVHVGWIFVNCLCEGDFVNDVMISGTITLLQVIGAAFTGFDGSGPNEFQICIQNRVTHDFVSVSDYDVDYKPTTLNKRMRA